MNGQSVLMACFAVVCGVQAQPTAPVLKIPPVKIPIQLDQQPIEITIWGTVSPISSAMDLTVDLGDFQDHLTPVLAAQLNRQDRCGERLLVERATLAPATPTGLLTANINFERYACVKAFGKQIVKKLVGGHGVIEVSLTPWVEDNEIMLSAEVQKIDADGSLGDVLRSGSVGDSIREQIEDSVTESIQKLVNLKSALPAAIENAVSIKSVQFADGGAGRLWLTTNGRVNLSIEELRRAVGQ